MISFEYHAPTALYFGENCISSHKKVIGSFGKRAFIITSKFSGDCRNYALEDIVNVEKELDVEYFIYDEVEENPSVESICRVVKEIREFSPDYIIAIGGGSALDTAKAANVLLKYPEGSDAYKVFYGGKRCPNTCNCGVLPLLGIPTTAGSGSEVMGFAILTRADTNTKLRMNQLSYFDASFLDARYVIESPQWLLDAGAMDALAHGIEGLLNKKCNPAETIWHNYGLTLFSSYKDALLSRSLSYEQCADMLLAASVQGMGNMQSGTTIPHGMGYPITHFKNITHGIASVMTIPAFLHVIRNREKVDNIITLCGFKSEKSFDEYIYEVVRRNVSNISVADNEIAAWSKECSELKERTDAHIEPITKEMIEEIYRETFKNILD